ncbi:MAG TPA: ATP-binding protein [Bryobacteraceae bacterium]|nr:ATP-binding protein [Bryobacteraceae bacterium]
MSTSIETVLHPSVADLRTISVFADLPQEGLQWLCEHMTLVELPAGEIFIRPGSPADRLFAIIEGEVTGELENGQKFMAYAGRITGMLPFSRLTHFSVTVRTSRATRAAVLHKDHFAEMLLNIPVLQERLVGVLTDRVRETTRADQQRDKLIALGKLSAGLAHELNNPAAAARRAADYLRQAMTDLRAANVQLGKAEMGVGARAYLTQLEYDWAENATHQVALDTMERGDREEQLMTWLEKRGVDIAWKLAPGLVDAGVTEQMLEQALPKIPKTVLADALTRLTASVTMTRLVAEIQHSMGRISDLLRAIKEYSYMDQMPDQDIDVHDGLENTLTMLGYRLKGGIEVLRDYDRSIPKIPARGSELNQVWTNLISNAIDAMKGRGKLKIRTALQSDRVLVEIVDTGSGIPAEVHDRIFEPFFTTKGVSEGTGLGLDIAYRIICNHNGDIKFDSKPGKTRFCIWLPLHRALDKPSAGAGETTHYSPEDQATRNSG